MTFNIGSDGMSIWSADGDRAFRGATIHTNPRDTAKLAAVDDLLAAFKNAVASWGDWVPDRRSNAYKALKQCRLAVDKAESHP